MPPANANDIIFAPLPEALPLSLEWDASLVPDACVVSPMASPLKSVMKESAGRSFHEKIRIVAGMLGVDADTDEGSSAVGNGSDDFLEECDFTTVEALEPEGSDDEDEGPKKKGPEQDHYAILGLGKLRWKATDKHIKDAYRKAALVHHPDRLNQSAGDDEEALETIERNFKGIQKAYEVLQDLQKRRMADSVDPTFNETIPTTCKEGKFFKTFGECFTRNARWSHVQPVPHVGDKDTPIEEVEAFYDFWFYKFKSWREFPHEDEEQIPSEDRMHQRHVARKNAALRAAEKKEEGKRLRAFIDAAYKFDPRIQAMKAAEKAKKDAKKNAKENARKEKEEAERKLIEDAAAAKEAAEAAAKEGNKKAKAEKEKFKKAVRKEKARLRAIAADAEGGALMGESYVETICGAYTEDLEGIQALCAKLEGLGVKGDKASLLQSELKKVDAEAAEEEAKLAARVAAEAAAEAAAGAAKKVAAKAKDTPWSAEEMKMLDKALAKFPKGTPRRWDAVTSYVRTRTQEEVIAMVKEHLGADANVSGARPNDRDKFIIKGDHKFVAAEAVAKVEAAAEAEPAAAAGEWSKVQEMALVKAIKAFPKDTEDRWGRIAEAVPGKNKAECFKQFAVMRDAARAAKA